MLGHQSIDGTDGKSTGGSPLMSLLRKFRPKRHHHSGSSDSSKIRRQRTGKERARNGKRDSGTSSVGSDMIEEYSEDRVTATMSLPTDVAPKPPGDEEIVSFVSQTSRQGDGMLRVTSDQLGCAGEKGEEFYKVDCKGRYGDPETKFLWTKDEIPGHENCWGVHLSVGSLEEKDPLRLCCLKMGDGKIHLAAHKSPSGAKAKGELLYICYHKDRSGVMTLQENVSESGKPLAGYFIGTTSDGELQMFPKSRYESSTSNPFVYFNLMDLDDMPMQATLRMNGEK